MKFRRTTYLLALLFILPIFLSGCKKSEPPPSGLVIQAFKYDMTNQINKPLGQYTLSMNSVPGFPVTLALDDSDITVTVDNGSLSFWNADTDFKVIDNGKKVTFKNSGTLYWMPYEQSSQDAENTPPKATMNVNFKRGNGTQADAVIEFNLGEKDQYYSATLKSLVAQKG